MEHQITPCHPETVPALVEPGLIPGTKNRRKWVSGGKEPKQSLLVGCCQSSSIIPTPSQPGVRGLAGWHLALPLSRWVWDLCITPGHRQVFCSTSLISNVIPRLWKTSVNCTCPHDTLLELTALWGRTEAGNIRSPNTTPIYIQRVTKRSKKPLAGALAHPLATQNEGRYSLGLASSQPHLSPTTDTLPG